MWPELKEQLAVEEEQIDELIESYRPLVERCLERAPDLFEISALAAFVHALYSGVENFFRRIAVELDGGAPKGEMWHQRLLQQVTTPTENRPRVISDGLRERLLPYLQFRHVFRNIYLLKLDWERMEPLVCGVEQLVADVKHELKVFVAAAL